jgi:hypothetical protein
MTMSVPTMISIQVVQVARRRRPSGQFRLLSRGSLYSVKLNEPTTLSCALALKRRFRAALRRSCEPSQTCY